MTDYEVTEEYVEVHAHLTETQFRDVGVLLGEPLGRHKAWSESYIFTPMSPADTDAVCSYLREHGIAHSRVTTRYWTA